MKPGAKYNPDDAEKCKCGNATSHPSCVCLICRVRGGKKETEKMATFQEKNCKECGNPFAPGGPRQTFCAKCRADRKPAPRKTVKPKSGGVAPEAPKAAAPAVPAALAAPIVPAVASGGVSVDSDNPLLVTVDLRKYPNIYSSIIRETVGRVLAEADRKAGEG